MTCGVRSVGATVRSAQADYDRAKADRDRIASLVKEGLVAQQDMDHAEATYRTAEATLDAARKRLEQARSEVAQAEASVRTQQAAVEQAVRRVDESRASLDNARSQRQQVGDHEPNRGFLRCLALLALAAQAIGEQDEWERCSTFLRDSSPAAADALL